MMWVELNWLFLWGVEKRITRVKLMVEVQIIDLVNNWAREYLCDILAKNLCVMIMLELNKAMIYQRLPPLK